MTFRDFWVFCIACGTRFSCGGPTGPAARYEICYACYLDSSHSNAIAFRAEIPVIESHSRIEKFAVKQAREERAKVARKKGN